MVEIGRINKLTVKRVRDYGAHLDGGKSGDIHLPKKDLPRSCQPGDEVEVFVYRDKEERLKATTKRPYAMVGQFACLTVVDSSSIGAYLDWGLQKDLFVPRKEQQTRMTEGRSYVVFVYIDKKTNRITASSKLNRFLSSQPPDYDESEEVDLLICEKTDLGYRAIINSAHWGMIFKNEIFQDLDTGRKLKGYIKKVRKDQKIDLSLQKSGYDKIDDTSKNILDRIKELGGSIPVTDKSPPGRIYDMFGISKKTFKKAIGALYKKRIITIRAGSIKLAEKSRKTEGRDG